MVGTPTQEKLDNVKQDTVQWEAKAHRIVQVDGDGNIITDLNPLNVTLPDQIKDVDDNGIAHSQILPTNIDLNYGYDETAGFWSRFIVETDNDAIPDGQTAQLVIPLMQYYDDKTSTWMRWRGESGSMWTTVIGLYTPTFDSILDDTLDTMKVSNDTAVNLKVDGSDVTQPISGTITANAGTNLNTSLLATSALQLPDNHNVTANAGTNLNTSSLALDATLTDKTQTTKITDGTNEVGIHNEMLHTVSQSYLIGEGLISDHKSFLKFGYNPTITNTEETIKSNGGTYAFMKGESMLQVVSDDNTQDIGSVLFNSTSTGGSTTTLIDTGVDFTAGATPVQIFDCVILDKSGATPEYGYVTEVTATTLTLSGGFSCGGSGDTRNYIVLNKTAYTGAQAVLVHYLDGDYEEHDEIVLLNGTTAVNTINSDYYRINSFKLIATGTLCHALGNISFKDVGSAPVYAYITAGYTKDRQSIYTVPIGKTLYLNSFNAAWCSPNDSKVQSARVILRANFLKNDFNTGSIFYPYIEVMVTNENTNIKNNIPWKVPEKTDIIVSCISTNAAGSGPATCVMRGWIKTD